MSQELYPSSGDPLTDAELRATAVPVDGSGVTQPVSASSLPLPTGASTAAKQPALGTAGTPSADVISIQGVTGGEPVEVTGSFTVTGALTDAELRASPVEVDGSGVTQPVSDAGGSITIDAPVGTPVFVRLSDGSAAISTLPVSIAAPVTVTNLGTFGVQADTELPAATSQADATGNPTAPVVGAFLSGWNGSSWDRVKTVNTGQIKSTLYDASGNAILPTPAALSDTAGNPTTVLLGACEQLWDPTNSQWQRKQAHDSRNLIASASYNPGAGAATQSAAQTNRTGESCFAEISTTVAGAGTLTLRIIGRAGGGNYVVLAQVTVSGTGTKTIMFGPGCTGLGTGGATGVDAYVGGRLTRDWYLDVVHSAASAWTYRVDVDTF